MKSRSFLLTAFVVVASALFTGFGQITGGQWVTLASFVLAAWQVKDAIEKRS